MPTCCPVEAFPPCQAICGRMTSCHLWLCGVACGLGLDFLSELASPQSLGSSFLRSTRVPVWRLLQGETNKKAPLGGFPQKEQQTQVAAPSSLPLRFPKAAQQPAENGAPRRVSPEAPEPEAAGGAGAHHARGRRGHLMEPKGLGGSCSSLPLAQE